MTTAVFSSDDALSADGILLRLRRGDPGTFSALFQRHFEPLTRIVARMVDSHHVAAELVQDVFLRIWSGRAELDIRGDLQSYLRRAARNRAVDWLRREELHREWQRRAAHEMRSASIDADGQEQDCMAQRQELLAELLAGMPERRRVVCELRWREGIGPSAIAQRLGVSVKTVETHITRGFKDISAEFRVRGPLMSS